MALQDLQNNKRSAPIRVFITDDNYSVRLALTMALEHFDDMSLVGHMSTCEDTLNFFRENPPDVLLLDLMMPVVDGEACLKEIKTISATLRVIILTTFMNAQAAERLISAGASGYIIKSISVDDLAEAIRHVHAGETVVLT